MNMLETTPTAELKRHAIGLYEAVYTWDCFGTPDLVTLEAILDELEHRGIEVVEDRRLYFN